MPKNNVQAKHRQPPMPLAARHSFSNGSKSRSQETSQRVQVMFKAKYIYKNYAFSTFDHTTMRKKTHQNELDGWKQDGWALALAKISSFAISSLSWPLLPLLFRHFKQAPAIIRYLCALSNLRACTLQPLSVLYRPTSTDSYGRLYCSPLGTQKLPKTLRSLLFGRTHYEVDLTGSHYQFFSRLASTLLQLSLPSVVDFRALLREDMIATSSDFLTHHPTAPKDLPTILLNSTLGDTITHFNSLGYYPSSQILAALRAIYHAKTRVLAAIENRFGKRTLSTLTSANRPFHVLEHVETLWLKHFATYLCQHPSCLSTYDGSRCSLRFAFSGCHRYY